MQSGFLMTMTPMKSDTILCAKSGHVASVANLAPFILMVPGSGSLLVDDKTHIDRMEKYDSNT